MQHTASGAPTLANLWAMPTHTHREEGTNIQVAQYDGDEHKIARNLRAATAGSCRHKTVKLLQIRTKRALPVRGCLSMPDEVERAQQSWHRCHYRRCVVTGRDHAHTHSFSFSLPFLFGCLLWCIVLSALPAIACNCLFSFSRGGTSCGPP